MNEGEARIEPVRVLVADDHSGTRAGVRGALEGKGFTVCAEASDAAGAVTAALSERPDLCLLDINMPGNGISAAAEITFRLPDTTVVMLTVSRDDSDLFDALKAGASGYLLKDTDPVRLPQVLQAVLAGETTLPRSLVARVVEEFRGRGRARRLSLFGGRRVELTEREWEVLELLREGLSTDDIAGRLFVSPVTVRSHVSAVLKKLRVPDRAAAVELLDRSKER